MTPAQRVAAVMAAASLAAVPVVTYEGWKNIGYLDPVGIPTNCAGHTGGVVVGKRYSDQECMSLLAEDLIRHGMDVEPCVTTTLPAKTRAAFISFSYNVGARAFCTSTLARKANAGDLRGACAELSRWTRAGGRVLPGLVRRRAAERAMCEEGLR